MKLFPNRLAFKIGLAIILVEMTVLTVTGFVYTHRFNQEIDRRVLERVDLPGSLVAQGLLTFSSVADEEVMRDMVGENLIEGMVITNDKSILTSLNPQHVRQDITELSWLDPDWFDQAADGQILLDTNIGLVSITPVYGFANDNTPFFVYIQAGTEQATREKRAVAVLFIVGSTLSIVATSVAIITFVNTTILRRISTVLGVLQQVESGQFDARVEEPIAADEMGILQVGVNSMITTLHETIAALEWQIHELQEARKALYTSERRFKSLIENSYEGILLHDEVGVIKYASPSIRQILGYSAEELIGRQGLDFVTEESAAEGKTIFDNISNQPGKGTAFKQLARHKNGSQVWIEATATNLLHDPDVKAIVWNFHDITRRVEQEQQIQQQERLAAVGQLAAGIAHDFNNILGVIVLYSQLALTGGYQLPESLQNHLQVIDKQAQRAADLIE
ncbi:MAG: PAS domain S-box protein, partial [Candidatus Promineifilaceae bacterium]